MTVLFALVIICSILENPYLKDDKKEKKSSLGLINKELRKIIGANTVIIAVNRIKELIENRSTMIFSRAGWGYSMEFEDDNISITIDENVSIYTKGIGRENMGPLRHFDIGLFLDKIPKVYWGGMYRDQQIESIFMD